MPYFEEADDFVGGDLPDDHTDGSPTDKGQAQPEAKRTYEIDYLGEKKTFDIDFDDEDSVKQILQKSLNNDRISEKWESSKAVTSKIEEIARKSGFVNEHGHGDIDAYYEAANHELRQREIEELTENVNLPPELAEELLLARQDRAMFKAEKERHEAEIAQQKQYAELLDFYKEIHGEDLDPATTKLPKEVWEAVENGVSPKHAYAEYRLKELIKEQEIDKGNADNAKRSAGSVTGKGQAIEKDYYTSEELDRLTSDDLNDPKIFEKAMRSMSRI